MKGDGGSLDRIRASHEANHHTTAATPEERAEAEIRIASGYTDATLISVLRRIAVRLESEHRFNHPEMLAMLREAAARIEQKVQP